MAEAVLRLKAIVGDSAVLTNGPIEEPTIFIDDPVLGKRGAPNVADHDSRGFRNVRALAAADVAIIGDSMVYGLGVLREQALPQQLAAATNTAVYNMGIPGYGPAQYFVLAKTALNSLHPRTLIVAIYLGNDLPDAYNVVYEMQGDTYLSLRDPRFETANANTRTAAYKGLVAFWQKQQDERGAYYSAELDRQIGLVERFFQTHTRIYWWLSNRGLISPMHPDGDNVKYNSLKRWVRENSADGYIYETSTMKTILTTSIREASEDQQNPIVAEGLRITEAVMTSIQAEASRTGSRVVYVLIPTKEHVLSREIHETGVSDSVLMRLDDHESNIVSRVLDYCASQALTCLDATPSLRGGVQAGKRVFLQSDDAHPAKAGYAVISDLIIDAMKSQ